MTYDFWLISDRVVKSMLCNMVATCGHLSLSYLNLHKITNLFFTCSSPMLPEATILGSTDIEHVCHYRKFCWEVLSGVIHRFLPLIDSENRKAMIYGRKWWLNFSKWISLASTWYMCSTGMNGMGVKQEAWEKGMIFGVITKKVDLIRAQWLGKGFLEVLRLEPIHF